MAFRGDRLKFEREKLGYTQDELASLINVAQSQIYRWERGQTQPVADAISNLAKILNVTADYLLDLVDEPERQISNDINLSSMELRLLNSFRSGQMKEALQIFVSRIPDEDV